MSLGVGTRALLSATSLALAACAHAGASSVAAPAPVAAPTTTAASPAPKRKVVLTKEAPSAIGPYSQGIDTGGVVFVSGQIPVDPATGELVATDIRTQADRALKNVAAVVAAAGLTMKDVARVTVYMTDLSQYADMNETYKTYFPSEAPARVTVQVAGLPKHASIEIEAIAIRPAAP